MPVDPIIARGVQPLDVSNALLGVAGLRQRDRALDQDQQVLDFRRNALMQAQQEDDEDDAEWEQAYAAKDWGRMARIDPQTTRILWDREQAMQPQEAIAPPEVRQDAGYSYMFDPQRGVIPGSVQAPQRAPLPRPAAASAAPPAGPSGAPAKPLPTAALRIVDEAKQAVAASSESKMLVDRAIATLQNGGVQLGAVRNLESRARNFAGTSDENSRAYADIRQTLEKLRNNYLLLAKGVQTEGDAQRAWNSEIGENVQNDNALALQQLQKAQGMIDRALEAQQRRIETIYSNFGQEPPTNAEQPSSDPLAPYAGQVIKQGGKRYQVMQGADGKYFAQEVK